MAPFLLAAGLVLLTIAGDFLVRGAVNVAQRLNVPPIVIGLTVVAVGTSAPELIVSVEAALQGAPGLAIGNIVGSNVTNALLVLGLPAIFAPIVLAERGIRRSLIFMLAISALVIVAAQDHLIDRPIALVFLALFVAYLGYSGWVANRARNGSEADLPQDPSEKPMPTGQAVFAILFGILGLGLGGKLTTDGALGVASLFNIDQAAVGLTIVALGTSLPELAASIAAAFRKQGGVAIGNVIGSNIFNILGILGISALIVPLNVSPNIVGFDMPFMLIASLVLVPIVFGTRRIDRKMGIAMTGAYSIYVIVAIAKGMPI